MAMTIRLRLFVTGCTRVLKRAGAWLIVLPPFAVGWFVGSIVKTAHLVRTAFIEGFEAGK